MTAKCLLIWMGLVTFVSLPAGASGEGLRWEDDLPTAQRLAQQTHKLVLIHFGGPWCPPCQRLEHQVFKQPGFGGALVANYVAVKVDPQKDPATAKKYGIEKVPTDVITTARGQLVYKVFPVPASAGAYVEHMNRLASMVQPPAELATGGGPAAAVNARSAGQPTTARPAETMVGAMESSPHAVAALAEAAGTSDSPVAPPDLQDAPDVATGNPPLALDGYCAVTLVAKKKWLAGDARWGAIHRGRTYLFVGPSEQQAFLAAPDRYAPVMNGLDPVLAFDRRQELTGKREFGAFFENRIYLFSSEASFRQFKRNPGRYITATRQASRR
ncbi:MAG TPA: thioredoxin family protein [Pirellulales bacterium]